MLDPVVIPAPLALGVVAALAAILAVMRWRWLDTPVWPLPPTRHPGRHRLGEVPAPFRAWDCPACNRSSNAETVELAAVR